MSREAPVQLSTRPLRENRTVAVEYKAARYGRTFVKVGRFEPTSQVCSACGHRDGPRPLSVRERTCSACHTVHGRDHNAAKNVKTAGPA